MPSVYLHSFYKGCIGTIFANNDSLQLGSASQYDRAKLVWDKLKPWKFCSIICRSHLQICQYYVSSSPTHQAVSEATLPGHKYWRFDQFVLRINKNTNSFVIIETVTYIFILHCGFVCKQLWCFVALIKAFQ